MSKKTILNVFNSTKNKMSDVTKTAVDVTKGVATGVPTDIVKGVPEVAAKGMFNFAKIVAKGATKGVADGKKRRSKKDISAYTKLVDPESSSETNKEDKK